MLILTPMLKGDKTSIWVHNKIIRIMSRLGEFLQMGILVGDLSNHSRELSMVTRCKLLAAIFKMEPHQLDYMTINLRWMELREWIFIHRPRVNSIYKWTTHSIIRPTILKLVTWLLNLNQFKRITNHRDPYRLQI